jgi:hypothetical protein
MAIGEHSRNELYRRLEEMLGAEAAATLMSYLPPVGWADVATKRDLDALEERIGLRFASVDHQFAAVDQRFTSVGRQFASVDERFASLQERIDLRFEAASHERVATVERGVGALRAEMNSQLRTIVFAVIASNFTAVSLAFAAARLH